MDRISEASACEALSTGLGGESAINVMCCRCLYFTITCETGEVDIDYLLSPGNPRMGREKWFVQGYVVSTC